MTASRFRKLASLAALAARSPASVLRARRAIRHFGAIQRTYELAAALRIVARLRPRVVLEIGSHYGGTLFAWSAVATRDALIIAVDIPYAGSSGLLPPRRRLRSRQRIEHVPGDSHAQSTLDEVKARLEGAAADFLFIDGDHSREGVANDLAMYGPLVRSGGLIGLHDVVQNVAAPDIEVWKLWDYVRKLNGAVEIVDVDGTRDGGMGIGLITMTEQLRNERAWQRH